MYLCEALVNFETAAPEIQELGYKLIVNFKAIAGNTWDSFFGEFPWELQQAMRKKYGV